VNRTVQRQTQKLAPTQKLNYRRGLSYETAGTNLIQNAASAKSNSDDANSDDLWNMEITLFDTRKNVDRPNEESLSAKPSTVLAARPFRIENKKLPARLVSPA